MANLTKNEKELLAVVKYYNDNEKKIDRLVYKLANNLSIESAAMLTGYNEATVQAIVRDFEAEVALRRQKTTLGKRKARKTITLKNDKSEKLPNDLSTVKFRSAKDRAIAKAKTEPIPAMVDEEFVKQGHTRLAIHIDANSDAPNRIAYDIAKAIEKDPVKPGTPFWKGKELAERFGSHRGIAPTIRRILIDHNWIAPIDESNPRLGYVVK